MKMVEIKIEKNRQLMKKIVGIKIEKKEIK